MSDWIQAGFERALNQILLAGIAIGAIFVGLIFFGIYLVHHVHIYWS